MKINNSLSFERIKKVLDLKTVLIVLAVVTVLSVMFYVANENLDSKELMIWLVTTDYDAGFSEGTIKEINEYGSDKGIDRILVLKRHPEDRYFDVVMSTSAFYSCDAFIMQGEMAHRYADMDMFMPLSIDTEDKDNILYHGDVAIGIKLDDDYYFLINKKTDIDREIIYDIYEMLKKN